MADTAKAQRLLAAKKKVKEYQKSKKNKSDMVADTKASVGSLTNSTHSSLNEIQNIEENEIPNQTINSVSPLQQYFTTGNTTIFDNINTDKKKNDFYAFDTFNYDANDTCNKIEDDCIRNEFHKINSSEQIDHYTYDPDDAKALEDPELEVNEIYNRLNTNIMNSHNNEPAEQLDKLSSVHKDAPLNTSSSSTDLQSSEDNANNVQENMQSLKQLSTQIIQMIDDNSLPNMNSKTNLELGSKTNDIYGFLQVEQDKSQKLVEEIDMYKSRIGELENESRNIKENNGKYDIQVKQLMDQINCHQQTINILVAEKSELENLTSQNSMAFKQKTAECEELSARLKTSRSRVADLEKELSTIRAERNDKKNVEQNEIYQKLLNEYETLRNQREEMLQDVSELQQKLNTSSSENIKLKQEVQELTSQLSLLNIKLQQLSSGDQQFNGHVEGLTHQINMFEKQVIDLNNVIKTLSIEKEQTSVQYQQYVQQLNAQLNTFVQKLEEKTHENEVLVSREQQLTSQMGELEKLLQKLQNDQQVVINNKSSSDIKKNLEEALSSLKAVQEEKSILEEKYQLVISERDDAFKELQLKKEDVTQLEEEINRLESNQPDNVKLLATIESDKVAASRAVAQNTELKKQLEEIQQAFIQISNNKLELTELLNDEKHKSKELNEKLNQFESQVHTLTDAIEIKDREMIALRESAQELNKYVVQQNQLEDRLRHYEAHDHSTHALQHELQDSYKKIQNLRSENETLKFHLKNSESKNKKMELLKTTRDGDASDDKSVLLSRINDLEMRNKEMEFRLLQLQSAELDRNKTETDSVAANQSITDERSADNAIEIQSAEYINEHLAMKQLEAKFTKTMKEIADLEDEKQRLEHLVMQLQDETETIGEYVTLYQHQRGILKQRALERDEQMRQLTVDREHMKIKIDQLNELVKTLILERGVPVSPELINQHLNKVQLCDEHAKSNETMLPHVSVNNNNSKTAEKIIELLSDIKTSNLVQPSETTETFHPCPWCSGQLITV